MKKTMLLVLSLLASHCFAETSSFAKNSPMLHEMGNAFKSNTVTVQHNGQATAMTYTGNDISRKPTLVLHTAAA
jgi:hypothetical protein